MNFWKKLKNNDSPNIEIPLNDEEMLDILGS